MIKKLQEYIWVCPLLIIMLLFIIMNMPDSDTFFLIATGKHIVNNGVPTINPFVIHENFSIVVQQWLFDIGIYHINNIFGNMGLIIFVAIMTTLSTFTMYRFLNLFTQNKKSAKLIAFAFGVMICRYAVARPSCVSILLFINLLYCLEKYHQTKKWKYLIFLPIISLLQINIHSSMWLVLIVFTIPYFFPYINLSESFSIKKWFNNNKKLLLAVLIMCICGLLNPYGINGIMYVINSYSSANSLAIDELAKPSITSANGIITIASAIFATMWLPKLFKETFKEKMDKQSEWIRVYGLAGTLILNITHTRNLWFALLWFCPIAVKILEKILKEKTLKPQKLKTMCCYFLTFSLICGMLIVGNTGYKVTTDSDVTPINAIEYLNTHNKNTIVLFTEFNNGAFCEMHDYKVYIDARPELFAKSINKKDDVLEEYSDTLSGETNFDDFIKKYNFTHMISTNGTLLNIYLQESDMYDIVVCGNGYCLFESINYQK